MALIQTHSVITLGHDKPFTTTRTHKLIKIRA